MIMPLASTPTSKKKIYRFALYGRKNAGKTCILAALAMSRVAHPDGLSCTWIDKPFGLRCSSGKPVNGNTDSRDALFFQGKQWLEQAIRNLESGSVPPPNPYDTSVTRLMYEFTAIDHRTFLVELIDYSGELIDTDLSDSELAKHLRDHMLTMDGVLVLAEAPRQGQEVGELYKELRRLKTAFALLRGEKQEGPALDVPIALLINKWDRRKEHGNFTPDCGQKDIQSFLGSQPEPPHRGLVDTLRGSVTEGNFKVFPVSAFGKHIPNDKEPDRPAQVNPLCSFGLEDGFVWACRRRDSIDLHRVENLAARQARWKLWQLFGSNSRRAIGKLTRELRQRFPAGSEEYQRVHRATARSRGCFAFQLIAVTSLAIVGILAAETGIDDWCWRSANTTLRDLNADVRHLEQSERWLDSYSRAPWFRHLGFGWFVSKAKAWETLIEIRTVREEYRKDWQRFEDGYHTLMRGGNLREAAQRLIQRGPNTTDLEKLKAAFRESALSRIDGKKTGFIKERQWARGREFLNTLQKDKFVKDMLLDEQLRKIQDMEHELDVTEDKHIYAQVENRKTRTMGTVQRYLADAPLRTMRKNVTDYGEYMKKMDGPLALEIEGTVLWGIGGYHNRKNSAKWILDGVEWLDAEIEPGTTDLGSKALTRKLTDKINLNVSIEAHTRTYFLGLWQTRDENGKGNFEGIIGDFLGGGKTIELDKYGNRVVLRVRENGLPKEPPLPEWRE